MATPIIIRRRRGARSSTGGAVVNLTVPVVSGVAEIGGVLTTTNGTWSGDPTFFSYQWKRNGAAIGGETLPIYVVALADNGATITVTVTASNLANSGTATSAGTSIAAFSPSVESQAVYALMPNALTLAEQIIIDRFVNYMVALGFWDDIRTFQCRGLQNAANSLIDWKGNNNATNVGATHTPGRGYRTNGTSSYISTGFNPSTGGGTIYTQNDGTVGWFIKKNNSPAATGTIAGIFQNATQRLSLSQVPTTNSYFFRVNNANGTTYNSDPVMGAHTHIHGGSMTFLSRSNSTTVRLNINGKQVQSGTETSTALANGILYEGCLNNAGVASGFMDIETGCFIVFQFSTMGSSIQKVSNAISGLMWELEGGYTDWAHIGISYDGQSNAEGFTTDTPSTSPVDLTAPIANALMRVSAATFATLDYPTNNNGDNYGGELTMMYDLVTHYGKPVRISKTAESGAPLAVEAGRDDFSPLNTELFPIVVDGLIDMGVAAHQAELYPINFLVWIQGERDTSTDAMANAYATNLVGFFDAISTEAAPLNYIVMNRINIGITGSGVNATRLNTVRAAQFDFTEDNSNSKLLDMDQFTLAADSLHYSGPTYETMGYIISDLIKSFNA